MSRKNKNPEEFMGIMKKASFLIFCFFCGFLGFSQEGTMLKGQLIFSSMNTSEINIINTTTHLGTTNNAKGEFEINASVGDELFFSSVQYEPHYVVITPEIFEKRFLKVRLVPALNELEVVTISNIDLTGNLTSDVLQVETEPYYNNNSFGMPMAAPKLSVEDRRLYAATSGGGLIPISLIINAISGELKRLNKLKEYAELDHFIEKAAQSLPESFFVDECGIPKAYIFSFMYFCNNDESFKSLVHADEKLPLTKFFKHKAREFREYRGWEQ